MTRKDYEEIASALNVAKKVIDSFPNLYTPEVAIDLVTNIIADGFLKYHENFNYQKFMKAVGTK